MNWVDQSKANWPEIKSLNPWDNMNEDQLLLEWQAKKQAIETAKAEEMDLRKYIVAREFPKPSEGMNTRSLAMDTCSKLLLSTIIIWLITILLKLLLRNYPSLVTQAQLLLTG